MTRLEQTLRAFQEKAEERFNKFESMMLHLQQNMSQRLDVLEKLCAKLSSNHVQQKVELKGCFNVSSMNAFCYEFWDQNQTINLFLALIPVWKSFQRSRKQASIPTHSRLTMKSVRFVSE